MSDKLLKSKQRNFRKFWNMSDEIFLKFKKKLRNYRTHFEKTSEKLEKNIGVKLRTIRTSINKEKKLKIFKEIRIELGKNMRKFFKKFSKHFGGDFLNF